MIFNDGLHEATNSAEAKVILEKRLAHCQEAKEAQPAGSHFRLAYQEAIDETKAALAALG